jgi:hypothetical protein
MTNDEALELGRAWIEAGRTWAPGPVMLMRVDPQGAVIPAIVCALYEGAPSPRDPLQRRWVRNTRRVGTGPTRPRLPRARARADRWEVWVWGRGTLGRGRTEVEALLAARKAAP